MEGESHPSASFPVPGGLIRLQARLANPVNWLSPIWAALCGVVASGGFGWEGEDWLRLALIVLLVDGGWGTLWAALGHTDWATALRRWRAWRFGDPVTPPPYTLPGSPGDRVSHWLGQLRAWWSLILWPACGPALSAILVALPVTAVLAALLGVEAVLLSVMALVMMQLGLAWEGGCGEVSPGWDALIGVALPWLAGHAGFDVLSLRSAGLALAYALAWGAAWRVDRRSGRRLGIVTQFLAGALLVALHRPLAAACVALLTVPQAALLPWVRQGQPVPWYVRHTRLWVMAAMLVAAWAL